MWNNLRQTAVKMCLAKVNNNLNYIKSTSIPELSSRFTIMRHKTSDPDCISDKRVRIEGEQCINKCPQI